MNDECIIIAVAYANGAPYSFEGQYLELFNADAYGGRGFARWTNDPSKAIRFKNKGDAFEFWKTQSKVKPLRPDGKPNRPLTAITIIIDRRRNRTSTS